MLIYRSIAGFERKRESNLVCREHLADYKVPKQIRIAAELPLTGAGKLDRCKKTLLLSIAEDTIATAVTIGLVLFSGRFLLSIFTSDPQVIELGYTRLLLIFSAYTFSMLYEIMSGYLRGFGISLVPALLTTIGVCGTRVFWIYVVFPSSPTFKTIMYAYPISLSLTAVLIFIALLAYHPSRRFKGAVSAE